MTVQTTSQKRREDRSCVYVCLCVETIAKGSAAAAACDVLQRSLSTAITMSVNVIVDQCIVKQTIYNIQIYICIYTRICIYAYFVALLLEHSNAMPTGLIHWQKKITA